MTAARTGDLELADDLLRHVPTGRFILDSCQPSRAGPRLTFTMDRITWPAHRTPRDRIYQLNPLLIMAKDYVVKSQCIISATVLCLAGVIFEQRSVLAQQAYLGTCDPRLGLEKDEHQGEYFKYECRREDGSIGWFQGTRIGTGRPILSIHERNTSNAHFYTKATNVYPGFFCYYNEVNGLERPSESCKKWVIEETLKPPERISADCNKKTVSIPPNTYKFPANKNMAADYDSIVNEAYRILCPAKFAASGVALPYKGTPASSAPVAAPKPKRNWIDPNHPGLGPVFKTTGLNREMQQVKKNHQAVLDTMRGGKNLLGHGMVQMSVISYEPGSDKGYQFTLRVNCYTREWKFIENDARLMGGAVEGFGVIRAKQMGPWACKRFGYSY